MSSPLIKAAGLLFLFLLAGFLPLLAQTPSPSLPPSPALSPSPVEFSSPPSLPDAVPTPSSPSPAIPVLNPYAIPPEISPPEGEPIEERIFTPAPSPTQPGLLTPADLSTPESSETPPVPGAESQFEKATEKSAIEANQDMLSHQKNITLLAFMLLIISLAGNIIFFFLLREAQQLKELNQQALKQLENSREFAERFITQTAKKMQPEKEKPLE